MSKKTATPPKEKSGLQTLLLAACPPDAETGRVNVSVLAKHLGLSPQGVYKWIRQGWIPGNRAREIVELSQGRVKRKDILEFTIPR